MFKKKLPKNNQSGMTFIELVVVMGIFTAISATVLFNYRSFSSSVSLQNLSQEIALQGKRAQTLATQGRRPLLSAAQEQTQIATLGNNSFGFLPIDWVSSYGLAFNMTRPTSFVFYFNSPTFYADDFIENESDFDIFNSTRNLYFEDSVESVFTGECGTSLSECLEEIFITDGSYIDLICINGEPQDDPDCMAGAPTYIAQQIHIAYTRPRLEAYIMAFGEDVPNDGGSAFVADYGFIRVSSRDGSQKRYVTFWPTGQIAVN